MFTPARYLVVDDERSELDPLVEALHRLGAPCIGIHWLADKLPDPKLFKGVRILFTDLHLTKGKVAQVTHFDTIASMLETGIVDGHGPYVLVLWTSHDEERDGLIDRLGKALPPEKLPIAVLGLDKNIYREGAEFTKLAQLEADVAAQLGGNAQLRALLSWEADVLMAADATLAQLGQLTPPAKRTIKDFPAALDAVLSNLAVASVGAKNAPLDRRAAVSRALAPLLMDRIANQPTDAEKEKVWEAALSFSEDSLKLTADNAARMNAMVHVVMQGAEHIERSDWGAIVPLTGLSEDALKGLFGAGKDALALDAFRLTAGQADCALVAVRVGAVCDYAQGKTGPVPFVLGVLTPLKPKYEGGPSPAEYVTPPLKFTDATPVQKLTVNARYTIGLTSEAMGMLPQPISRIREQLLVTLVNHNASHVVRPGFLSFRG